MWICHLCYLKHEIQPYSNEQNPTHQLKKYILFLSEHAHVSKYVNKIIAYNEKLALF